MTFHIAARLVAAGIAALDLSGMVAMGAESEFGLDMMYIIFMFGVFFLSAAACVHFPSRMGRAIAVTPFLFVAFGPVVEHILITPVAVM